MVPALTEPDTQIALINKIRHLEYTNHMIAHNLRGASLNIQMLAEILMNKNINEVCDLDEEGDMFTTKDAIRHIYESSASLLSILNTLMQAADIQLNENIRYDQCDIAGIVAYTAKQLSVIIQEKKASITLNLAITHISYPLPYMESMLYNFINNALKYCKTNVPLEVVISTYAQNGATMLSVKDNGMGIDLNRYGTRIFNLYEVFHAGSESKGVGLYIIKTQIESLGGTVSVKSEVNEGSEFTVVCLDMDEAKG